MSDSPPPFNEIDDLSLEKNKNSLKNKPSDDLFFSAMSDENKQGEDIDEIFKASAAKNNFDGTSEIRLDDDDFDPFTKPKSTNGDSLNSNTMHKPFVLPTSSLNSPNAASINVQPTLLSTGSLNETVSNSGSIKRSPSNQTSVRASTIDIPDEDDEDKDKFIQITVTDPAKVGKGMSSFMQYKVTTKTNLPAFKKTEFIVHRRFSDFLNLYEKIKEKHLQHGRFLPPSPEKDIIGNITGVKMSNDDAAPNEFIEKRKASLERFLNRVAQSTKLRYDPDFRDFLELPEYISKSANASKFDVMKMFKNVGEAVNKISVKLPQTDQWFDEKSQDVEMLYIQLKKLHSSVETLCGWRRDLAISTKEFAKSGAVLAHSEEHISLAKAISQLGDLHEKLEQLESDQSHSDFYVFSELLKDYIGMLDSVKEAFYQRVKLFQAWQKAEETLKIKQDNKTKLETTNKQDKIPTAMAEIKEWEGKVDKCKEEFEQISKTIKQEMRRFESARANEFKETLTKYLKNLLEHQQAVLKIWEQYLPEVKAI